MRTMRLTRVLIAGWLLAFGLSLASAQTPAVPKPIDTLTDAELDQVLTILKTKSTAGAALSETELKRAAVTGLMARLEGRVTLLPARAATPPASPFHAELLGGNIGYLRMGSLSQENMAGLDTALAGFAQKAVAAEILDLRATPAGTSPEETAALCERWAPKGQTLFTVTRREELVARNFTASREPAGSGMLIVLTCSANAGSVEIAAAVLRGTVRALVIGGKTAGEAGEFAEQPLGDEAVLRYPVGEVSLPWPEWPGAGVWPDLPVDVSPEETTKVLKAEAAGGLAPLLAEHERARLNEAALVAGKTPELDALEASQREHEIARPALHDAALQRAVDVVTSLAVFGRGK